MQGIERKKLLSLSGIKHFFFRYHDVIRCKQLDHGMAANIVQFCKSTFGEDILQYRDARCYKVRYNECCCRYFLAYQ